MLIVNYNIYMLMNMKLILMPCSCECLMMATTFWWQRVDVIIPGELAQLIENVSCQSDVIFYPPTTDFVTLGTYSCFFSSMVVLCIFFMLHAIDWKYGRMGNSWATKRQAWLSGNCQVTLGSTGILEQEQIPCAIVYTRNVVPVSKNWKYAGSSWQNLPSNWSVGSKIYG